MSHFHLIATGKGKGQLPICSFFTSFGDGSFLKQFRVSTGPFLSGIMEVFFAGKMHSTTEFAMTVLSKCVTHVGSTRCREPVGEYLSR